MSDNITLPRELVQEALDALEHAARNHGDIYTLQRTALRARLAAPEPEPEPVAWVWLKNGIPVNVFLSRGDANDRYWLDKGYSTAPLYAAPPVAAPEPVRHPGYVIGNHWLETAYERLCAGEAEDAILEDYELVREPRLRELRRDAERYRWLLNWLVKTGLLSRERCRIDSPASYGDWWILRKPSVIDGSALIGYGKTEDAAIDAAMEDKR